MKIRPDCFPQLYLKVFSEGQEYQFIKVSHVVYIVLSGKGVEFILIVSENFFGGA